jgi:hypothetical protein
MRPADRQWLRDLFLVRSAADPSIPFAFWLGLSVLSVVAATAIAARPDQLGDLWTVRGWLTYWLEHGNPYLAFDDLDYPPASFFVLWPLAFLSDDIVVASLIPAMVLATALATWLMLRWFSGRLGVQLRLLEQGPLVGMVLAGAALRGAIWRGQTAPFAFLFGALALTWAERRPVLAAMALALCAFKPHVAIGFGLVILFTVRRDVVFGAAAIVLGKTLLFAALVDQPLHDLLNRYLEILAALYEGPDGLPGLLSIRWVLNDLIGNYDLATYLYSALAAASLVFLASTARRRDAVTTVHVAAACLIWSLVFLPHQQYNGMLAVPLIWLLMWPEAKIMSNERLRLWLVMALVLFRVLDVPRLIRLAAALEDRLSVLAYPSYFLRPIHLALLLTFLLVVLWRRRRLDDLAAA